MVQVVLQLLYCSVFVFVFDVDVDVDVVFLS